MEKLFDSWKNKDLHKNRLFITDGIVDENYWKLSESKTLFLLKEAYDSVKVEGSWDLSELIRRKTVSGRTLKPMAQWSYGISNLVEKKEIISFQKEGTEVKLALMSSAVVNLKKSSGKSKSSSKNLSTYIDEDWGLISKQIEMIRPKIIICGNTWSLIHKKISYEKVSDRAYLSEGILYIDYWHPANRASNKMNYYALCALVELAMKKLEYDL